MSRVFFLQWFLPVLNCFRANGLLGFRVFQTGFTTFGSKIRDPAQKKYVRASFRASIL